MSLFLSFLAGLISYNLSSFFPILVSVVLIVTVFYSLKKRRGGYAFVLLLAFLYASWRDQPRLEPFICQDTVFQGYGTDLPVRNEFGYGQSVRVLAVNGCSVDIRGKDIRVFSSEPLELGRRGLFRADIKGKFAFRNPHSVRNDMLLSANLKEYSLSGSRRTMSWYINTWRSKLAAFFHGQFSPDVAGFLEAVTIGRRTNVSDRMREGFAAAGLAHLLAISGAHFGVFSFIVFSAFRLLLKRLPYVVLNRMMLYSTPSQLAAILSIPLMVFYLFLSGAGIPAIRSFMMINVFLFGLLLGRKGVWKNTLAFAAFVILLITPDAVFDISFILSFAAVFSIGYVLQWYRERSDDIIIPELRDTVQDKLKTWAVVTLLITLSAFVGTAPLGLYLFHSLSVIAPATNMVIAPIVCFLIIPVRVAGSLLYLATGYFPFATIIQYVSHTMLLFIEGIRNLPFVEIVVPAFPLILPLLFYAGLLSLVMPLRRVYGIGMVVLSIALIAYSSLATNKEGLEVTFLDVGQAESSVLVLPDKNVMVIDTGKDGKQTVRYLDYRAIKQIDALILSHAGSDHAGGLEYVSEMKDVTNILDNGRIVYPSPLSQNTEQRLLQRGDIINSDGYTVEVLHPYDGFYTLFGSDAAAENNDSLVVRITVNGLRILFTGDIEAEAEEDLLHVKDYLKSDILKVAHHGSRTSTSARFLSLVSPSIAIISTGMFNPFGHPQEATVNNLEGLRIYNTANDGAIKITVDGSHEEKKKRITVKTFDDHRLQRAENLADEIENYRKLVRTW